LILANIRGIKLELWKIFFDEQADEFVGTSFTKDFITNEIRKKYPKIKWSKLYYIIGQWSKKCDQLYSNTYGDFRKLIEVGVADSKESCINKYNNFLRICVINNIIPIYYDKDIQEWRVAKDLDLYGEYFTDKIMFHQKNRDKAVVKGAKKGAIFLSGVDSRSVVIDMLEQTKKLENKKDD